MGRRARARPEARGAEPVRGEWLTRNLFSSAVNSLLTVVFSLLVFLVVRGLLNFTFSEERTWRAVKTNMRFLFTHAYPQEQYARIWVCVGAIAVLSGLSVGPAGPRRPRHLDEESCR